MFRRHQETESECEAVDCIKRDFFFLYDFTQKKLVFKQGNFFSSFFLWRQRATGSSWRGRGARYDVNKVDVERVSVMSNPV